MGDFFAKLLELFSTGNKNIIIRLIIAVILGIVFVPPVLDYFYINIKIEQEIRILKELNSINVDELKNEDLKSYYNNIIDKIKYNKLSVLNNIIVRAINYRIKSKDIIKFISSSFCWIVIFIYALFSKVEPAEKKPDLIIFLFSCIIAFGIFGSIIPTFTPFIINVVGIPLIQIISLFLAFLYGLKKKLFKFNWKKRNEK